MVEKNSGHGAKLQRANNFFGLPREPFLHLTLSSNICTLLLLFLSSANSHKALESSQR